MSKTIHQRLATLESENAELRRLWIETEGDLISLRTYLSEKIAELEDKKEEMKVSGLTRLIMKVHRGNGGIIRSNRK